MPPLKSDVQARLCAEVWADTIPKAILYARTLHSRTLATLPGSPSPEDLVQEAITRLLEGERNLPKNVSVLTTVIGIIRSLVSHEARRLLNYSHTESGNSAINVSKFVSLDSLMVKNLKVNPCNLTSGEILNLVEIGSLEWKIIHSWCLDPGLKPKQIAERLNEPRVRIYKAIYRLRHRLKALKADGVLI